MAPDPAVLPRLRRGHAARGQLRRPEIGALNVLGSAARRDRSRSATALANYSAAQDQDEENPADIQLGESFIN